MVAKLEGPYVVKEALPRNSYRLINADGVELPDPINARHLKKFYTWNIYSPLVILPFSSNNDQTFFSQLHWGIFKKILFCMQAG